MKTTPVPDFTSYNVNLDHEGVTCYISVVRDEELIAIAAKVLKELRPENLRIGEIKRVGELLAAMADELRFTP